MRRTDLQVATLASVYNLRDYIRQIRENSYGRSLVPIIEVAVLLSANYFASFIGRAWRRVVNGFNRLEDYFPLKPRGI